MFILPVAPVRLVFGAWVWTFCRSLYTVVFFEYPLFWFSWRPSVDCDDFGILGRQEAFLLPLISPHETREGHEYIKVPLFSQNSKLPMELLYNMCPPIVPLEGYSVFSIGILLINSAPGVNCPPAVNRTCACGIYKKTPGIWRRWLFSIRKGFFISLQRIYSAPLSPEPHA